MAAGDFDDFPVLLGVDDFRLPELALCEDRPLSTAADARSSAADARSISR